MGNYPVKTLAKNLQNGYYEWRNKEKKLCLEIY